MDCLRCHSAMIEEVFQDYGCDAGPSTFVGWHCIICGAILDSLILSHQAVRPSPAQRHARTKCGGVWVISRAADG